MLVRQSGKGSLKGLGAAAALVMERNDYEFSAQTQGTSMAIDGAAKKRGASPATETSQADDFPAHARDYSDFVRLFKWGAIISFVTAILVMFLIS